MSSASRGEQEKGGVPADTNRPVRHGPFQSSKRETPWKISRHPSASNHSRKLRFSQGIPICHSVRLAKRDLKRLIAVRGVDRLRTNLFLDFDDAEGLRRMPKISIFLEIAIEQATGRVRWRCLQYNIRLGPTVSSAIHPWNMAIRASESDLSLENLGSTPAAA